MRTNFLRASLNTGVWAVATLLCAAGVVSAQQPVNLTAGPTSLALPDGNTVPMWGYTCAAPSTATTPSTTPSATCKPLNSATTGWSPVLITVPSGQDLQINLTNNLKFGTNSVPTSLVIVGQVGGGLGTPGGFTPAPDHSNAQQTTWPVAGGPGGPKGTPPAQGHRVQSFATEVAVGATTLLTWTAPRPGTYLIESGTHPSIQGPMGLYGILVVTDAVNGTAYPKIHYDADIPLLMSEIDPVQNTAVNTAVNTPGFSETAVWSGQPGGCGNPTSTSYNTCYPPAVNYTPLYYLFNGVAFDKTNALASVFSAAPLSIPTPTSPTPLTGNVLVRFVNAGLRMHVPSIVGSQTGATGVSGFSLIAEDGNVLPGVPRVQSEVFLAAGKTYDVMLNVPATPVPPAVATALPVFDRQLSLSSNGVGRDAGMLAYLSINGAGLPNSPALAGATANPDTYNSVVAGQTLNISDPARGVMANDVNVYGVKAATGTNLGPFHGTLVLNGNGTFTYTPDASWSAASTPTTTDSFSYQANGGGGPTAVVTLNLASLEQPAGIQVSPVTYTARTASSISIKSPGVLSAARDLAGYPLSVALASVSAGQGLSLSVDKFGGFNATVSSPGTYTFTYKAQNSQGTQSAPATVTVIFPQPSGLQVSLIDGKTKSALAADYRWIIEEDRTFYIDPAKSTNNSTSNGTTAPTFGTNFHTSYMPVVAQGCVGTISCGAGQSVQGVAAVCDGGNGVCRTTASQQTPVDPSQVVLDPTKRYYISVLPGDGANYFQGGTGHGMGGAPIAVGQTKVTVIVEPTPYPPSKLSVFVFEDDFPLNGEADAGGGGNGLAPNEPGLGQFNITIFDDAGGPGDPTGQVTYDMFNMPLSNSLAGTIDPSTGLDACPISPISRIGSNDPTQTGITGTIVTCPKYETDGVTESPLAGQVVVANMMPGRYGVVATPGADRIAKGEEWLQTNTLDGQKAHDSFLRVGEPSFFQEYGPAGYHVSIGFANPKTINSRLKGICDGSDPNFTGTNCTNTVKGMVTTERMSRTPDERLYSSGSNDSFAFTQCYVSLGDPDGEDFAFTKCKSDGTFSLSGIPSGSWRVTVFDQWNDMLVDGLSTPVGIGSNPNQMVDLGQIAMNQWQANLYTKTFFDANGDGVAQAGEQGLALVPTNIRFRDGSFSNFNNTDLNGNAGFNEVFPLFNWYVVETDTTRYKNTGTHVVYDAGGPADGSAACGQTGYPPCGNSTIGHLMANTAEQVSVPPALRVPGSVYCDNADCNNFSIKNGPTSSATGALSTGRIDPPWVTTQGWQGFAGQNSFLEFGKTPYAPGENGGIHGHVVYASTRPFDDPQLLLQTSWEPLVPGVTINLYQEGTAPDGSQSLTLVDTTKTSSWDDWAQGFRSDGIPNMNCPGQTTNDLFFFSLQNQPMYLDLYSNQGTAANTLPNNSQFKCYDGMHNWNQLQPAPYDGQYQFPSVSVRDPKTGAPTGTNCLICVPNPTKDGTQMLPAGKYVVEVVVPPGYELVKEEDKNILIGDNFIAPATQQFGALGSVFILPDQAAVGATYNAKNAQNPTQDLGTNHLRRSEGDTGTVETYWPCVGESRIVPDYISLFPGSKEVAPFAGATRNLCDRKEVTLSDQMSALAKFYIFTSTHAAAHFTGVITDDFTSEFDPFSPQFGEKFAPPDLPISIKDWAGNEIARTYADHWGAFNGLNYSTWEVNPPNPTGYSPTMMITCMNDPGSGPTPDPLFNPGYSQFCYEIPFMPGQTQYMDTPVTPTSAFSEGYNHPDCSYPDATPSISEVNGDGIGPWVSSPGNTITIKSLGDQFVNNSAYSGPSATTAPYNQKTVKRHYGFGTTTGTVTIGGINAPVTLWSDSQITITAPPGVPACAIQQQAQYGGSPAQCGQLVITEASGRKSIDAVTVTIGGKAPIPFQGTIQATIDGASPGDLIIVPKGVYKEMILMWKPVRLQGVGAASSVINANTHPAGKIDPWRRQVACLFGLALNGTRMTANNPYDKTGTFSCPAAMQFQVDRLPLEATVGWDVNLNGNLAELLQEPTLMGAYEGAAITVLGKGVVFPTGQNPFGNDVFPTGTTLLTISDCASGPGGSNPNPSNFWCNPSRIDGLSVTDSSQGGGGIFAHGWNHNLEVSNDRVYNNTGTLAGGISIGQGEFPPGYLVGGANAPPGSCQTSQVPNQQLPYCFNEYVNVHNNSITLNSSIGDELFSSTLAGAGGVTFCSGSDYYKFNNNWLCGNLGTGDGGGFAQLGFVYNADIEQNKILFNQSTNPTVSANGGGIIIMGAPDTDPVCTPGDTDADCPPGLGDGTGPGLVINANLIMGNAAESGSGGGLRLQGVNGAEVPRFPKNPEYWYHVLVTNNIITNNIAGWDGGGISLQDALYVDVINNTISSNDSTASAGPLFNTLGAPLASSPGPTLVQQTTSTTSSAPQPAGLVAILNSSSLLTALPSTIVCPKNHPNCRAVSYPLLNNNIFWQNRSFYIGVGSLSSQYQQNIVTLYNSFTATAAPSQPQTTATTPNGNGFIVTGGTGACPAASYWDIGVRGDTGPSNHSSGVTLAPVRSILTDAGDYTNAINSGFNPQSTSQYCNGSRTPPELGTSGYQVPPGIADATVPNPVFNLSPAATVDEGNNWVNIKWGPLSVNNPVTGTPLGNYAPAIGSPAIDYIPLNTDSSRLAPTADYFGNPRPAPGTKVDAGAVEFQPVPVPTVTAVNPNTGARGATVPVTISGTNLLGATLVTAGQGITVSSFTVVSATSITATFQIAAGAPLGPHNVRVTTPGGLSPVSVTFTVVLPPTPSITGINPNSGVRGTAVIVTLAGTNLTAAAVNVSGTGITKSNIVVGSPDTSLTVTLTIAANAPIGNRNVSVTTPGGTSGNLTFAVQGPTLATVNPSTVIRATSVPITFTGVNLDAASKVVVSGGGVSGSAITVSPDGTTVTATITVTPGAAPGQRTISLVTPIGTTNGMQLNVATPAAPTLSGISPSSGVRGTTFQVTLSGSNFTAPLTVNVPGGAITVSNIVIVASDTATATFTVPVNAGIGNLNISVKTPGGTTGTKPFAVQGATLTGINPGDGTHGTNVPITLTGMNLTGATSLVISGNGSITVVPGTFVVVDANTITATLAISNNVAHNAHSIAVRTPIGTTNATSFTVN